MAKKKMDYFNQAGVVSPMEYLWYEQFQEMGRCMAEQYQVTQIVDVGKVLGLARYTVALQNKARNLAKTIVKMLYAKKLTFSKDATITGIHNDTVDLLTFIEDIMELTDNSRGKKAKK